MSAWVKLARLEKAKTLKGGLVARSVSGLPFLLVCGLDVTFVPPQIDAPRHGCVVALSEETDTSAVVNFDSVTGIEDAEALVGCYCLARRADLPAEDLVLSGFGLCNFSVYDAKLGLVGKVLGVEVLPGQNLLRIDRECAGSAGEALIPLVDEMIVGFDEGAKRIDMNLPSGLLEI